MFEQGSRIMQYVRYSPLSGKTSAVMSRHFVTANVNSGASILELAIPGYELNGVSFLDMAKGVDLLCQLEQLYDLGADPNCKTELISDLNYAAVVDRLERKLREYLQDLYIARTDECVMLAFEYDGVDSLPAESVSVLTTASLTTLFSNMSVPSTLTPVRGRGSGGGCSRGGSSSRGGNGYFQYSGGGRGRGFGGSEEELPRTQWPLSFPFSVCLCIRLYIFFSNIRNQIGRN